MKKFRSSCPVFCILLLSLLVSACNMVPQNSPAVTHNLTAPSRKERNNTNVLRQLLQKSSVAMKNLRSVHFELDATLQYKGGKEALVGANLLSALQLLSGPQNAETQGSGDAVAPSLSRTSLSEMTFGFGKAITYNSFAQNDSVYLQDYKQDWYIISKEKLLAEEDTWLYVKPGMSQIADLIALAVQKGMLSDGGKAIIKGRQLHHITATFNKTAMDALQTIDVENRQGNWDALTTDQSAQAKGAVDFWIDESTGYTYQVISTLAYHPGHLNGMNQQSLRFQCSEFNLPIVIHLPAHAISINSIDGLPQRMGN